ncbi:phage tail length tape measure family protein [Devosia aurantiaca]|uniref:Bacteriophage tail tape measure N-terminal domain-containing protein n=1 Tax=Devosia aurantiaca TaxID=2714858 RepID=A0A6M1SUY5_9HYPH|nr:phage tail length tape measure family protein [Devosia aurantiaca]NGP18925.1 hypothetical protein [Devosia aurantiaca]
MTQAITELVVRGDGALAALDRFEASMEKAGIATEHSTGAIADFERRMAAARSAIERGNAITTESVARKTAEQRAWDKWSATVDRTSALRLRLEREAAQASVAAANAVNLGYATQEQALSTLVALERRHAEQLRAVTDQHQSATQATLAHAAANDNLAISTQRAAAMRDVGGGNLNTANIAAQFQDIGVTAAMGMSPIMIALQQGTQLSAVLNGMQSPIKGLAAGLMSIVNPVSLLTIGFVALAAAAVQWFASASAGSEESVRTLQDHKTWLNELLAGYDAVAEAATKTVEAATRLPEGVVRSDLTANLLEQYIAAQALQQRISDTRNEIAEMATFLRETMDIGLGVGDNTAAIAAGAQQIEVIRDLGLSSRNTAAELEQVMVAARELYNTVDDPSVQQMAKRFYDLALELFNVQAQAEATRSALATLNNMDIQISVQADTSAAISAIEDLKRMMPELRSVREQARDSLNEALGKAPDEILRQAARNQYADTIAALDERDRRDEAAKLASKAARGGGSGGGRQHFAGMVESTQQSIDQLRLQAETMSMTGQAAAALRHEQELLNQAANDNIALSPAQREEIALLSEQYAQAEASLAGVQFAMGDPTPWDEAIANIANLDAALATGAISWEQYGAAAFRANSGAASAVLGLASGMTGALASMFKDNKAFAVANAVVSTAEAVMKAMATYGPTPWGFAAAGVAAATGAAQIATIMSAQKGSGSVSRPSGGATAGSAAQAAPAAQRATQINLTLAGSGRYSREDVRDLIEQLTDGINDGVDQGKFKLAVNS